MNVSKISVIIPTYQHATTIAACLESIFAQTLQPLEVIVVNDGSTDGTKDVLERFVDHVTIIEQNNQGSNPARNRGFEASKGSLVIFCDADVIMRPNMLEMLVQALEEHQEAAFAYSGFRFGWKAFPSFNYDAERLRQMNYIHTTALIRRETFPGFDPSIKRLQDWDVWLTMLERGAIGVRVAEELFRIVDGHGRTGISQWRPAFFYRMKWDYLGWKPASLKRYLEAKRIVQQKHGLLVGGKNNSFE